MNRLVLLLLAALLLGGCATPREKGVFSLGIFLPPDAKKLTWPPATDGEVPRYVYLGELVGEPNYVRPKPPGQEVKNVLARFFDIVIGDEPPEVFDRPQAVAIDAQGRIFVTDIGRASVFVFDDHAGELQTWTLADGLLPFVSPVGIAIGPDGQVLVADPELKIVARIGADGTPLEAIGRGEFQRPVGVAYDAKTKQIFVADTQAHQILVFDPAGTLIKTIGERGERQGEFNYPTHLAVGHEKLYVTDTLNARIQVFSTPTGRVLGTVGKRGTFVGNLVRPKGVAADREHNIYVTESYHDYLLIYNRRGEFLIPIGGVGGGPGQFHLPAGIAVDARNRIFVADMINSRVAVFQFLGGDDDNDDR